jgi:hypothetical protein
VYSKYEYSFSLLLLFTAKLITPELNIPLLYLYTHYTKFYVNSVDAGDSSSTAKLRKAAML